MAWLDKVHTYTYTLNWSIYLLCILNSSNKQYPFLFLAQSNSSTPRRLVFCSSTPSTSTGDWLRQSRGTVVVIRSDFGKVEGSVCRGVETFGRSAQSSGCYLLYCRLRLTSYACIIFSLFMHYYRSVILPTIHWEFIFIVCWYIHTTTQVRIVRVYFLCYCCI